MILLFNPRAVKPRSRRLPLSVLALAAVLEGREEYEIVDGNVDDDPASTILDLAASHFIELLGVTVMPGPQMVAAMEACRENPADSARYPHRVGRLLPVALFGCLTECEVRRLRSPRPGRRHAAGTVGSAARPPLA